MKHRPYRLDTKTWSVERIVFLAAGILVVAAAAFALTISPAFIWADLFFGLMLALFATTGYCPMAILVNHLKNRLNHRAQKETR